MNRDAAWALLNEYVRDQSLVRHMLAVEAAMPVSRPSASACGFMASMTNWMCSVRSTPKSAAPRSTSSRLTPRAKPLDFIFFLTLLAVRSVTPCGRTSAAAVIRPASSSQAYSALSMRCTRGQSGR